MRAASAANATIVTDVFHQFNPFGISGVVVIAESHIAIHTWPEHACASLDLFSCGSKFQVPIAIEYITQGFKAKQHDLQIVSRGKIKPPTADLASSGQSLQPPLGVGV